MARFAKVLPEGHRTIYASGPNVVLDYSNNRARVNISYASSLVQSDGTFKKSTISFDNVLDFHFHNREIGLPYPDQGAYAFELITVNDSSLLAALEAHQCLERTASPIVTYSDLKHYRIAFDDHGVYDVVALDFTLSVVTASTDA